MQFLSVIDPLEVFSGLCVGVLVGMTGVGGGSIMTPLLILVFGAHPAAAVGTDLVFAASTKIVGTLVHGAARTIQWRIVALLAAGSIPGTVASLLVLSWFDLSGTAASRGITLVLACTLFLTSAFLLFTSRFRNHYANRVLALSQSTLAALTVLLGLAMGVLVTVTSIGAGAIGVSALMLLYPKMPAARIIGSDIAHALPLTIIAGGGHWLLGSVDWNLLMPLLIGSVPGIIVGSYFAKRTPDGIVRAALAVALFAVAVGLIARRD
jgi:uncharacterized protein